MFRHAQKKNVLFVIMAAMLAVPALGQGAETLSKPEGEIEAPMWWLGFQMHGATDAPAPTPTDPSLDYFEPDSVHFGTGLGLSIPLGLNLYRGLGVRSTFSLTYSGDPLNGAIAHISFLEPASGGGYERVFLALPAIYGSASLFVDAMYTFPLLLGTFKPYLGFGPGFVVNYVFTDLSSQEFELLDNEYNDPYDEDNIDPYSVNLEPGAHGFVGVNFKVTGPLHLNLELDYARASMDERPLLKATDDYDARRGPYVHSVLKFSSGLLFNF